MCLLLGRSDFIFHNAQQSICMKWHYVFPWFLSIYFCFFLAGPASAQMSGADSNFYQSALSRAINLYYESAADQSGLYNGALYPGYPFPFKEGDPFFNSNQFDTGSVVYDGLLYNRVQLRYDNLKDVVIINDNGYWIQLNDKKVNEFTIPGHHFISLGKKEVNIEGIDRWFYELLYPGDHILVLKKIMKTIEEDLSNGHDIERIIHTSNYYYIKKDSVLYPIEKKKDLNVVFPDKKKEIQQLFKKNKIKFRRDKENALLKVAAYFEPIRK